MQFAPVPWQGALSMYHPILRLRHFLVLAGNLVGYAVVNRAWWVPALTLVLGIAALLVVVGQTAAPVTLYPLF